jgi:hypothetical protein
MSDIARHTLQCDYILLDCSSSMGDKWHHSLTAIDTYVGAMRAAGLKSRIIFHPFYSDCPDYHQEYTSDYWTGAMAQNLIPSGTTPLYDAIWLMGMRLREMNPPRASIVIVTDGDDNASTRPLQSAKMVLDFLRAKGYQVTFIGADFANSAQASLLGAAACSAVGVQKALMSDAARNLAEKRKRYALFGEDMHFTEGERQQFGGYLAAAKDVR